MRTQTNRPHSASSYPKFDPHITLASFPSSKNIPLSTIRAAVLTSPAPVSVEFKSIEIGDHFFRSVYLAVKPTAALSALHEHIHAKLGLELRTPAFPHISLCYIDEEDARNGERANFLQELDNSGRVRREEDSVGLNCAEDLLRGFEATEVWVTDCDGPVNEWSVLARIPLVTVNSQ
jgi:2',3'-cyclic-nucleotide 3'-phosphodiesterase